MRNLITAANKQQHNLNAGWWIFNYVIVLRLASWGELLKKSQFGIKLAWSHLLWQIATEWRSRRSENIHCTSPFLHGWECEKLHTAFSHLGVRLTEIQQAAGYGLAHCYPVVRDSGVVGLNMSPGTSFGADSRVEITSIHCMSDLASDWKLFCFQLQSSRFELVQSPL